MADYSTHKELLEAMGSKNGDWDPTAPEWYLRSMESRTPVEQLMGWMQRYTIRHKIRKPYASDESGRILTLQDLGAFYHWKNPRKAERAWTEAESKGWVKRAEGKLWLRADFKVRYPVPRDDDDETQAEPVDPVKSYVARLPPYIQKQVAELPPAGQVALVKNLQTHDAWKKEVEAAVMMAARDQTEPPLLQIFASYGISVKTGPKTKTEKRINCAVKVELLGEPKFELPQVLPANRHHAKPPSGTSAAAARPPAGTPPPLPAVPAAEFFRALGQRFHGAGADPPTRKQADTAYRSLAGETDKFLEWLSPGEMARRKPRHGGVLPSLVEEFQLRQKLGPKPAAVESVWEQIDRERREKAG